MTMKLDRPLQLRSHLSGGAPAAREDAATPLEIVDPWRGDLAATLDCVGDSSVAHAVQSAKAAYRSNCGSTRDTGRAPCRERGGHTGTRPAAAGTFKKK